MRKIFLAAALSICAISAKATGDFKRVVQIAVSQGESLRVEGASIEVEGKTICTNEQGVAYLDVPPGRYSAKVSRMGCSATYEIEVTERTGFISLRLNCD